jgi:hypothetical protein
VSRRALVASLLVLIVVGPAAAQVSTRRLATIETLRQFPGYFNLQSVLVRGEFVESGQRILLRADDHEMNVLLGDIHTADGLVEVRAQMLDVGRLEPSDPRLTRYTGARDPEHWPKPGEELILNVTGVQAVQTATEPTVRALALEPWKFEGQRVTVTGQFRGRNLFGDLPGAPAKSKYDFVLRAADGAIWVTGLRPKAKNLDLDVDARVDTSRWVQVTGMVKRERTMLTIEASAISGAQPPSAPAEYEPAEPAPPLPPGEVVFSSPTQQETDVPLTTPVRLQFSRGLDPVSIAGNIRISYTGATDAADAAQIPFDTKYDAATRSVEIRFAKQAPEAFKTVTVETLEGLKTFEGAAVTPWKLTFSFGS